MMSPPQSPVLRLLSFRSRSAASSKEAAATPTTGIDTSLAVPIQSAQPDDIPDAHPDGTVKAAQGSTVHAADATKGVDHEQPKNAVKDTRRFTWFLQSARAPVASRPAREKRARVASNPDAKKPARTTVVHGDAKHQVARTRSQQKAYHTAEVLRDIIVGPELATGGKVKSLPSASEQARAKTQLTQSKTASKVITELRQLPAVQEPTFPSTAHAGDTAHVQRKGPIHAVYLAYTEQEAHEKHFARLAKPQPVPSADTGAVATEGSLVEETESTSFATASLESVNDVLSGLNIVSLITTPNLGIGEPGDGPGILSGAVPTAETVIQGIEQITPQLMALGYATGKAIMPNHTGVYPPTDRMSVLTYWWGFELVLPPSSLVYLENVPSIAHSIMNFLTAVSVVEGGVRELLPFVRYISQFIDTEFSLIKQQNHGKGVVCAATWLLPAALVPRPWDFPDPPEESVDPAPEPASPSSVLDIPEPTEPIDPTPALDASPEIAPAAGLPSSDLVPAIITSPDPDKQPVCVGVVDAGELSTLMGPVAIA